MGGANRRSFCFRKCLFEVPSSSLQPPPFNRSISLISSCTFEINLSGATNLVCIDLAKGPLPGEMPVDAREVDGGIAAVWVASAWQGTFIAHS